MYGEILYSETPVERRGGLWFKREDLFEFGGMRGAKVRAALLLCLKAREQGHSLVVSAGSRHSPQLAIVGAVCRELGVLVTGFVAQGSSTPVLKLAESLGVALCRVKVGYSNAVRAKAGRWAFDNKAFFIPFGMFDDSVLDLTKFQVRLLVESGQLKSVKRIVIVAGSGVNLIGLLQGLKECSVNPLVVGVLVGHDCRKFVRSCCDYENLRFVKSPLSYECPSIFSGVNGVDVDSRYEGKLVPFLRPGDLFWDIGFVSSNLVSVTRDL